MEKTLTFQETAVHAEGKRFAIRAGAYIIDTIIFYILFKMIY